MNFFALQLLFFAFAYRCVSARLVALPSPCHGCAFHFSSPPLSFSACRSRSLPLRCGTPQGSTFCHRLSPRCGTMPLRFISWRYRALPLPRLSSLGNALALLWYATFCLALARLIASIRSNAVALLLETVLCSCSTSHVDALPLQGVTVRG